MTVTLHRIVYSAALALLLLLLTCGASRGDEKKKDAAEGIVASMLKAYGGTESIARVVSVTAKGRITELLGGKSGDYVRYFKRPRKLRIEVMPEQGGEIRILNGNRGWRNGAAGFESVSGMELQSMLYQYSYLNLPMGLATGSYHAEYGGKKRYNGEEAYLLLIEPKNAPKLEILVDAKSSLIIRVDASFIMGPMGTGELSTIYSDFRPVAGVMVPHKLASFAGGIMLSEIVLDEIEVNPKLPPGLFAPPGGEQKRDAGGASRRSPPPQGGGKVAVPTPQK